MSTPWRVLYRPVVDSSVAMEYSSSDGFLASCCQSEVNLSVTVPSRVPYSFLVLSRHIRRDS